MAISHVTAATKLPLLTLAAKVTLGGIQIQGNGEWRMEGDYPGQAHVQIPRIPFATLHDLAPGKHLRKDLPFDGFLEGEATITGPLNQPVHDESGHNALHRATQRQPQRCAQSREPKLRIWFCETPSQCISMATIKLPSISAAPVSSPRKPR